jgi:hypothetical protein
MVEVLNAAGVAPLVSIGHQTGLFDTLAGLPAATSGEIARAAGLNERYVREWLGGIAASKSVDYQTDTRTCVLPPHHAPALTRAGGVNNVGQLAQLFSILGEVEQQVVLRCWRWSALLRVSPIPCRPSRGVGCRSGR